MKIGIINLQQRSLQYSAAKQPRRISREQLDGRCHSISPRPKHRRRYSTPTQRPPVRYATLIKILVLYCSTLINVPTRVRARERCDARPASYSLRNPPVPSYGPATSRCHLSNICKQKMVSVVGKSKINDSRRCIIRASFARSREHTVAARQTNDNHISEFAQVHILMSANQSPLASIIIT